ncbi:MAG: HEPN domain-containing protein [Candidatus Methanomethylicia archaeon]
MNSGDVEVEEVARRFGEEVKRILGDEAVAVVAFGSRVWGKYSRDSDYDLLLLHRASEEKAEEAAVEAALKVSAELRVGVEPVVMSIFDFRGDSKYLTTKCRREGLIIYLDGGGRHYEAIDMILLAEEFLEIAEILLKHKKYRGVIDEAYNAAELAVKALMLWDGYDIPGSHGGIIGEFGRIYVLTGKIDRELGRLLSLSLEKRNKARYNARMEVSEEEAKTILEAAGKLIKNIKQYIKPNK